MYIRSDINFNEFVMIYWPIDIKHKCIMASKIMKPSPQLASVVVPLYFEAKRTQQIFIVATCDFCFFKLPHTADFYRCQRQFLKCSSVKQSSRAALELYFRPILCSSIGLASHVVHDFCRETPHTADFCL